MNTINSLPYRYESTRLSPKDWIQFNIDCEEPAKVYTQLRRLLTEPSIFD